MALFGNKGGVQKTEGGFMDAIRCDEPSYLIWKWRPKGAIGDTRKENAIRYGSSLRVKDGEVAVFVYGQKDGTMQDFIEGPYDDIIKTANFPVLASIVGLAFGGSTPFQAEVYYINLAGIIQTKFAVPFFDVFDPRFLDFAVPVAVRGSLNFKITDYKDFIKLHRLIEFNLDDFEKQIRDAMSRYVKGVVVDVPQTHAIPVVQLERKILQVNDIVENYVKPRLLNEFGVTVSSMDISAIELDKESEGYRSLMKVTKNVTLDTIQAQAEVNIKNINDTQRISSQNMEETLRIQREEMQRAQKLQTEGANFAVHQLNQQTLVAREGAQSIGQLGAAGNMGGAANGNMNPGAMMASMAMGGAVGQGMAGMMGNMMSGMNQQMMNMGMPAAMGGMSPPPVPGSALYNIAVNGASTGPFDMATLQQMAVSGQLNAQSLVWTQGMSAWTAAGQVAELAGLFTQSAPPVPPPIPSEEE